MAWHRICFICLFPAKISIILNGFLTRLPFYETLELHAQIGLENIPDSKVCQIFSNIHILICLPHLRFLQLLSNLSFYNGSKGALLTFGVLWSYLIHYNVGYRVVVLWQRSTKWFVGLSLEACKTQQTTMAVKYSKILNKIVHSYWILVHFFQWLGATT